MFRVRRKPYSRIILRTGDFAWAQYCQPRTQPKFAPSRPMLPTRLPRVQTQITMYINSPGGVVTAGLAIYDTMQASALLRWC